MKKILVFLFFLLCILFLLYFATKQTTQKTTNSNLPKVTSSIYPLSFFTMQVAGDKASVYTITPAGTEPHDYDPTTKDIAHIEDSKLLILNGSLESWANDLMANLTQTGTSVVFASGNLLSKNITEEGKAIKDPHIWLSPLLALKQAQNITSALSKVDPNNTEYYNNNLKLLEQKLLQLDTDYKHGLANCETREIITSHTAFAYLADTYQLKQIAISGLSPDAEPSAKELGEIASFAQKNKIKYIFFESLVSPKLSETVAREIGAKTLVLDPIEGISDDDIKQGKDYFTIMRENLKNLQIALACKP